MVTPAHKPKYIMKEYNPISCRLKKKKNNKFCYSCSCMDRGVENNWLMYNICIT